MLYSSIDYLETVTGTTAYACTTDTSPTQGGYTSQWDPTRGWGEGIRQLDSYNIHIHLHLISLTATSLPKYSNRPFILMTFLAVFTCTPTSGNEASTRITGEQIIGGRMFARTMDICKARCEGNSECVAYDMAASSSVCTIYRTNTGTTSNSDYTAVRCMGRSKLQMPSFITVNIMNSEESTGYLKYFLKKMSIRTCYFLCKELACYHSTRKTLVKERVFTLNPIHA